MFIDGILYKALFLRIRLSFLCSGERDDELKYVCGTTVTILFSSSEDSNNWRSIFSNTEEIGSSEREDVKMVEVKNFEVTCPQCDVAGTINVPTYLFKNKKAGNLKIQVNVGMVCEHEFVVFIARSGKVMGYETIDVALNLADFQNTTEAGHIFLPDILKIFGKYGVSNQFHAVLLNTPIKVLRCDDDFNYAKPLTTLFNEFLPVTYKDQMIIVSNILEKDYKKAKIDDTFLFNTTGVVANAPWEEIELKLEEDLIVEALKFLDPKMLICKLNH